MNYLLLAAGIISSFAVIGHFTMGKKMYLNPILESNVEDIPKQIMRSLFHYASVFMVFTTIVILKSAFGKCLLFADTQSGTLFIGIIYGGMAFAQIIINLTSPVKAGLLKMFQWVFWTLIACFSIFGSL